MIKRHYILYLQMFQVFKRYSLINNTNSTVPYNVSAQVGQYWVNYYAKINENQNSEETDRFGFIL